MRILALGHIAYFYGWAKVGRRSQFVSGTRIALARETRLIGYTLNAQR